MRVRDVLDRARAAGGRTARRSALATVVGTFRSAPRPPGASMLVGPDGEAVGSVSGGCVEGAVYELGRAGAARRAARAAALRRLRRRRVRRRPDLRRDPRRLRREGEPRDVRRSSARSPTRSRTESPVAVATVIARPGRNGSATRLVVWPDHVERQHRARSALDDAVRDDARGLLDVGPQRDAAPTASTGSAAARGSRCSSSRSRRRRGCSSSGRSTSPRPCAKIGSFLGYRVTVCDARPVFATASRFPGADEVVVDWPHRYLAAEAEAGRDRRAHRALRADPRPEVRRPAARGRAAAARGRLHRRDGLAPHPRRPAGAAARARA